MPLFTVSLLFSLEVQAPHAPEPLRELALHVLTAGDRDEAHAKGDAIGKARETIYENKDGELVRVVEVQSLIDDYLFDGMDVASWMFERGERLILDDRGIAPNPLAVRCESQS